MEPNDDWKQELKDLLAVKEGLTDWEIVFIENVWGQAMHGVQLSDKQKAKIAELWDKRVTGGPRA